MSDRGVGRVWLTVAVVIGVLILDISRGSFRGNPSQVRNEDMMEHVRELREEAEHEHLAREVDEASHDEPSTRGLRALVARIFRR